MCYSPLFGDLYLKDEVARELLAEGDARESGETVKHSRTESRGDTDNESIAGDYDILTGGATGN